MGVRIVWSLALLPLCAAVPCGSRLDCNATQECVRSGVSVQEGFCASCSSLPEASCFPPCYFWTDRCKADRLASILNLDLLPPYYFLFFGSITKAFVQLWLFPPTREIHFVGMFGLAKKSAQWGFVFLAVLNFFVDVAKLWRLAWSPINRWQQFLATLSLAAISPNMASAVGAVIQVMFLGMDDQHGSSNVDGDEKAFGLLFVTYAYALALTYGLLFLGLMLMSSLGAVLYIWAALPACLAIFGIGWAFSLLVVRHISRRTDLTDSLVEDVKDVKKHDGVGTNLHLYFISLMLLPTVQFLMITQMRLLDGFGYSESFYLTITERHIGAYLATVREKMTAGFTMVCYLF